MEIDMSKKKSNVIFAVCLIVLIILCTVVIWFAYSRYKALKEDVQERTPYVQSNPPMPEDMIGAKEMITDNKNIIQPEGYGVERSISEVADITIDQSLIDDIGNLDFDDMESSTVKTEVVGDYTEEEKRIIGNKIEKDVTTGRYITHINWSSSKELSDNNYKAFVVVAGKMLQDELNSSNAGRYQVIANPMQPDTLEGSGLVAYFDIDSDGYLTIAYDATIRDLVNRTEVQEIRTCTLYYDGIYLAERK